jgi:phosphopantothenoylcysteine decarboxylase / phosphopantothenate---cysteine ligase
MSTSTPSTRAASSSRILLGVTGGIAAYKSCLLVRRLVDAGHELRVAMSAHAARFVGPLTFSTLSGHPVAVDPFAEGRVDHAEHIDLSAWAEHFIVAPATANILAKAANGLADDFLSTLLCAFDKPVLFAPAMNHRMWANPAVRRNCAQLGADGHVLVEPGSGYLACGETGAGRMAEPEIIHEWLDWLRLRSNELAGRRVVVSAGPTAEDLDEVRFFSNRSTGRMGFALARAAQRMGAETRLIAGPVTLPTPLGVCRSDVRSAAEMAAAVKEAAVDSDLLLMCAAVADYRPPFQAGKLKKGPGPLTLVLERSEDILATLAMDKGRRVHVGFALETEQALERGRAKLEAKALDLICVNNPREEGAGFAHETNRLTLIDAAGGEEALPLLHKDDAARRILLRAAALLEARP